MNTQIEFINASKINDISNHLLQENGKMKLLSYIEHKKFIWEDFRVFCHNHARYGIPTVELVSFLKEIIGDRHAIEIGAGCGDLGYHLGIKMTDSKVQEDTTIKEIYKKMRQPLIKYGEDVEKLEASEAIKKYKPKVVLASWVTVYSPVETSYGSSPYGVKEDEILDLVDTYILIGSLECHGDKPIMKIPHKTINEPFIISRNFNIQGNRIFIWEKSK